MRMSMSSLRVHCWLRWAFGPFSGNIHHLTSPEVRTFHVFSPVRTKRKSAPFRVGYPRLGGPLRPVTRRRSLFPSSHPLCSVPLPYGRDTTCVGSIGLTQLSMEKSVDNPAGVCAPVGFYGCRRPQSSETVLPTYHFGDGLSASLAILPSRGFTLTLHLCSALFSFPSPSPRRGWQRPEHCPQSFVPRMTRQHVWVGTPEHRRARSGSLSPSSILLHRPCEVSQEYGCAPPGHNGPGYGAFGIPRNPGVSLHTRASTSRWTGIYRAAGRAAMLPAWNCGWAVCSVWVAHRLCRTVVNRPAVQISQDCLGFSTKAART
jgi:hypothetical protein